MYELNKNPNMNNKYFLLFQSDSPSASVFNQIGKYLLGCLGFVVVAMLEFALIILINRRATIKKNSKDNFISERKSAKSMNSITKNWPNSIMEKKEEKEIRFAVPPIHVIDFVFFWVHLSSFLIFNIIYWNSNRN